MEHHPSSIWHTDRVPAQEAPVEADVDPDPYSENVEAVVTPGEEVYAPLDQLIPPV